MPRAREPGGRSGERGRYHTSRLLVTGAIDPKVTMVHLQNHRGERGAIQASSPLVEKAFIHALEPTAGFVSMLRLPLRIKKQFLHALIPRFPRFASHMKHDLGGVVVEVKVLRWADLGEPAHAIDERGVFFRPTVVHAA